MTTCTATTALRRSIVISFEYFPKFAPEVVKDWKIELNRIFGLQDSKLLLKEKSSLELKQIRNKKHSEKRLLKKSAFKN